MADLKFESIEAVEIFSTGTWNGSKKVSVTEGMLDDMVAAFNALSVVDGFRPPVKLGHDEAQAFMGQTGGSGAPALGWVHRLWRSGNKVLADFRDVPSTLVDLIRRRLYNSVSIELLPELEYGGATFRNVLGAVAVLGAELPAVKGLRELSASLFDAAGVDRIVFSQKEEDTMAGESTYTKTQVDDLVSAAVDKAVKEAGAKFAEQIAASTKALETAATALKAEKDRADGAVVALQTFQADKSKERVVTAVDAAIEKGQALPAEKEDLISFGQSLDAKAKIKFGDKEMSPLDRWIEQLAKRPKAVDFSERGRGTGDKERAATGKAGAEVDRLAKAIVASSSGKIDYKAAVAEVLSKPENTDLKTRYSLGE